MMVSAIISNLSVINKLDSSNYEDIARLFMGSEAYLLFHFDKLITTVSLLILLLKCGLLDAENDPELEESRRLLKEP